MRTGPHYRMQAWILSAAMAAVLLYLLPVLPARAEFAATNDWPQEILTNSGKVLVYQPQLESLVGDTLSGRAAISFTPGGGQPAFGAFWFEAKLRTDRDSRTYVLEKIKVPNVKFPELDQEKEEKTARLLEREIPKWNIHGSLDSILPALEMASKEQAAVAQLRSDPPKIVFRTQPSVLLLYDGKPRARVVEGSNLKRVENTPFFVVQDASGTWYLNLGEFWYSASDPAGPWKPGANPPASVRKLQAKEATNAQGKGGGPTTDQEASPVRDEGVPQSPDVVVATEPTELIQTDGKPKYASFQGIDLLYVENTANRPFPGDRYAGTFRPSLGPMVRDAVPCRRTMESCGSGRAPPRIPQDSGRFTQGTRTGQRGGDRRCEGSGPRHLHPPDVGDPEG